MTQRLAEIRVRDIAPNPNNPRIFFRQEEMDTLLRSIHRNGVQVPITVYEENGTYILIDGERRWRCSQKLNRKTVPAIVQDRPTPLQNLLLMYNIHALREQWDYYTIAVNLKTVIALFVEEKNYEPGEVELSESTGLTRGQIRRCRLLINLPDRYQNLLLEELDKPKARQKLSEDFFIEMEKALKTVTKRYPEFSDSLNNIRDALVTKFQNNTIGAVTDFRLLGKIATAPENLDISEGQAKDLLSKAFSSDNNSGIRQVYDDTLKVRYEERQAERQISGLRTFLTELKEHPDVLDDDLRAELRALIVLIEEVLGTSTDGGR